MPSYGVTLLATGLVIWWLLGFPFPGLLIMAGMLMTWQAARIASRFEKPPPPGAGR